MDPERCPTCGSKRGYRSGPVCLGEHPDPWHDAAPPPAPSDEGFAGLPIEQQATSAPRDEAPGEVVESPEQGHARKVEERRDAYPSLYCAMWPDLKAKAKALGYALLIHGSLKRDLDLVAVPWTDEAVDARTLADAMKAVVGGWTGEVEGSMKILADKPHGRLGAIIVCGGHAVIDLSIMPTVPAAVRERERAVLDAAMGLAASESKSTWIQLRRAIKRYNAALRGGEG